jgi:beta-lactamase regulating signal transducer with metallopeptidase domain
MDSLIQVLGWALIHAFWQGCLLVLLAAWCGLSLRGRTRHRLNGLILLLCLVLPAATAWRLHGPVGGPGIADRTLPALEVSSIPRGPSRPIPVTWLARLEASLQPKLPGLVILWAVGAGLMALRLGGGFALSLRWRRQALLAPEEWQAKLGTLARRMGILRPVRLLLAARGHTPMAMGLWKPVILLPAALLTSLPPAYLEALLAHELAHVHRLDYLSNLLQGLAETLLFFHPAIWWLSARIRAEREEHSDDLAAQCLGDPRQLALALNALDDLHPAYIHPLFPALAARGGSLLTRIEHLLSPRPRVGTPWGFLTLLLIPCAALALRAALPGQHPIGAPPDMIAKLDALAAKEGLDPQLLRSMAWVESGFNARAKSPRGATGLLQVMPGTARTYGAKDLDDPAQVMAAGAKYLRVLLDRYQGDVPKAVAAYNCGEKALEEGRITEEATRYRALVLDVLAAKAVQPEVPLAEGEVQGVIRRTGGDELTIHLRANGRGNLNVDLLPADGSKAIGTVRIGGKESGGTFTVGPWMEFRPNVVVKAPKAGVALLIRCEDPGTGWKGETLAPLDGPWKTFTFRMQPPKP